MHVRWKLLRMRRCDVRKDSHSASEFNSRQTGIHCQARGNASRQYNLLRVWDPVYARDNIGLHSYKPNQFLKALVGHRVAHSGGRVIPWLKRVWVGQTYQRNHAWSIIHSNHTRLWNGTERNGQATFNPMPSSQTLAWHRYNRSLIGYLARKQQHG